MNRRVFLKAGSAFPTVAVMSGFSRLADAKTAGTSRRVFEVTKRVQVLDAEGATRVWLPAPLSRDTGYFKNLGNV